MKHSAIWLAATAAMVLIAPRAFAAQDVCVPAANGSVAEVCAPAAAVPVAPAGGAGASEAAPAPVATAPRRVVAPVPTPVAVNRRSVVAAPPAPVPPYRASLESRRCNSMLCPYFVVLGTGF